MLLDSTVISSGLFMAAVDYIPSLFLLSPPPQKKIRNSNNLCCTDKYITAKQRGSDMGGKIANREEGFSAVDHRSKSILENHCQFTEGKRLLQASLFSLRYLYSASSSVN